MPKQEPFFEQKFGDLRIEVIKTYDQSYAREVFKGVDEEAYRALAESLELDKNFDVDDIPSPDAVDYDDFLWEELHEAAREDVRNDPNLYSFFVVAETRAGKTRELYVSPDWPGAEAFAKKRIVAVR